MSKGRSGRKATVYDQVVRARKSGGRGGTKKKDAAISDTQVVLFTPFGIRSGGKGRTRRTIARAFSAYPVVHFTLDCSKQLLYN